PLDFAHWRALTQERPTMRAPGGKKRTSGAEAPSHCSRSAARVNPCPSRLSALRTTRPFGGLTASSDNSQKGLFDLLRFAEGGRRRSVCLAWKYALCVISSLRATLDSAVSDGRFVPGIDHHADGGGGLFGVYRAAALGVAGTAE